MSTNTQLDTQFIAGIFFSALSLFTGVEFLFFYVKFDFFENNEFR